MTLAHTFGEGGPEIEFLVLAAGLLVLAIVFFFQKTVKPQVPVILVLAALALTVGAFAFDTPDETKGNGISTDAEVVIVDPSDGGTIAAGETLTLEIRIDGGSLTTENTTDEPDAGHLHIYVDGKLVSMPSVATPKIDGEDLPAGEHEIIVEFTQADHRPWDPPVQTAITVTAE